MSETLESIIEWHKWHFKQAEPKSQRERFEEEYLEFKQEEKTEDKLFEIADMVICAAGLSRFCYPVYSFSVIDRCLNEINKGYYELSLAIDEKMAINRQRAKDNYWAYDEETKQYVARHKLKNYIDK